MKLLDLFCGAGGASMGYFRAGFEVVGVDIQDQPRYPFKFYRANALDVLDPDWGLTPHPSEFDVIHASPPCQAFSDLKHRSKKDYPDLITPIREKLKRWGGNYIIENVEGAPLISPTMFCGQMFGLRVIRHRLFETNFKLWQLIDPPHPLVYTLDKRKNQYGKLDEWGSPVSVNGGGNCSVASARDAMGINWMTKKELNEAIPPAYTEFIGWFINDS